MKNKIKLSIITVNFNNDSGLEKTIESVLAQTFSNYEFIIIDGGSNDKSMEIIDKYKSKIAYYISEKDNGIYEAMNKGISVANGEYLQFLNSGDYLLNKNVLEKVFKYNGNQDIYYGSSIRNSTDGRNYRCNEPKNLTMKRFFDHSICHQAMFIKKELFNKFGKYNEKLKIVADWEFNVRTIILNNCSLKFLNFPIVFYDMNGLSMKKQKMSLKEKDECLNKLIPARILADYKKKNIRKSKDFHELEDEIERLKRDLHIIQSAKFYKMWQEMNSILRKVGIKKQYA